MAVAELIGAAIGVLLLVTVAYLLVGGTLSTAETVVTAQKDLTLLQEARLRTGIMISHIETIQGTDLKFNVTNNGNEIINDLPHLDVYSFNKTKGDTYGYTHYTYDRYNLGDPGNWSITAFENDNIHANELDPGVNMSIRVIYINKPDSIQVTTSNGVSAISSV